MWRHTESVDYAIKILICLAKRGGILSSALLSSHIGTSPRYTLHICSKLKDAGLITVMHGTNGGFMLKKAPEDISLLEVTLAAGQNIEFRFVERTSHIFTKLYEFHEKQVSALLSKFGGTTIADLL